jgi:hypothetical protein
MTRVLVPLSIALTLVASGVSQGLLSDRWSSSAEEVVQQAREKLDELPMHIGDWDGIPRQWIAFDQSGAEKDFITRGYINHLNGDSVGLLIAAGLSRNVRQWHTPMQCYPAQGYDCAGPVAKSVIHLDGVEAEFFHADFTLPRASAPDHVRVFWAFSGDGHWLAPDSEFSQFTFGRYRTLYKVYVLRQLKRPGEPLDNDSCIEFLKVALPQVNKTFFQRT